MRDEFDDFMNERNERGLSKLIGDLFDTSRVGIHSPASISHIITESNKVAQENPEVEGHKTYIVSFPARIVTVVTIDKGMVTCFDKGYVNKKVG